MAGVVSKLIGYILADYNPSLDEENESWTAHNRHKRELPERARASLEGNVGMITLGNALELVRDRLETFQQHLRHCRSTEGAIATAVGSVKLLTFERYRVCELCAEMLHRSNMAIMNRGAEFENLYDADGRSQGGLQGLEQLAKVIAIASGEEQNRDKMGEDNDEIEPAMEPPVSNASRNSHLLISSDEDTNLETMRWKRSRCTMIPRFPQISHLLPSQPAQGSNQSPPSSDSDAEVSRGLPTWLALVRLNPTAYSAAAYWADLERLLKAHSQGSQVQDPSSGERRRTQIDPTAAEVLDCWRVKFGVSGLDQRFKEHPAHFEDLLGDACALCQLHISGSLVENAVLPNPLRPAQFPGGKKCMLHYDFQCANLMEISDVRWTSWRAHAVQSGSGKGSNELLELACGFQREYSSALQELIKNNWLCSLSGVEGNIRDFLRVKDAMKSIIRLAEAGGAHHRTLKEAAMNQLADREGRTWGYAAQDDFEAGFTMITLGGNIGDFVARMLTALIAIHGEDEDKDDTGDLGDGAPLPTMLVNGVLISGDELGMLELEGDSEIHREMEDLMGSRLFGSGGNREGGNGTG
ncbi:hypothetical protein FIBSPDRAFT_1010554 [Athelia psychrophila]|uniref:DUF6589 domain-containing protein n=1 Tax=Athelia psychrophila TaxID=1759441 RepID=A0A167UWF2_9AGAM|nr:hypothetical protein FIBSPDRAFT_1010554 [Fibularhizoctonia sp. CBS 109695]